MLDGLINGSLLKMMLIIAGAVSKPIYQTQQQETIVCAEGATSCNHLHVYLFTLQLQLQLQQQQQQLTTMSSSATASATAY